MQTLATVNATPAAKCLLLKSGTVVEATLITTPSSIKVSVWSSDPKMNQTKKSTQRLVRMKVHVGVNADSGLVNTVERTAASINDMKRAHAPLDGEEI